MTTEQVIIEARKQIGLLEKNYLGEIKESSARLCLTDAVTAFDAGDYETARRRAIKSLAYSVGILHPVYRKAVAK